MYNIKVEAVSKVQKNVFGILIEKGDNIELLMNGSGYAALSKHAMIRFSPHEYDLYISDDEFDKLLNAEM